MRAGAVGVAVQGDDVGVVDEAVDGRGGYDVVAEGLAPVGEREVGRHDHRPGLISRGDELEEQRRRRRVERQVAHFVELCRRRHRPDELGYVQIDPRGAELLFQVITAREERASIAIATNLPFEPP